MPRCAAELAHSPVQVSRNVTTPLPPYSFLRQFDVAVFVFASALDGVDFVVLAVEPLLERFDSAASAASAAAALA
jgi:hypothetical protein